MSSLFVICFLGGFLFYINNIFLYKIIFAIKILFISSGFIFARGLLPRYRYDQLILICWKEIMPFSFGFVIFLIGIFFFINTKPLCFLILNINA